MHVLRAALLAATLAACSAAPPLRQAAPAPTLPPAGVSPGAYALEYPPDFTRALERGTRTERGTPGARYWQNYARYRIRARVDVAAKRLEGRAVIEYRNHSPDTLELLHIELPQNLHAPTAMRFEEVEATGGVELRRVAADGRVLGTSGSGPRYGVFGTRLVILPPRPIAPGGRVTAEIEYAFQLPQAGAGGRMGYRGDDLLYLAYWYPQLAVYDDVVGWHPDPFLGTTEFYAGFADYEYEVDVPAGWVVLGTGTVQNAAQLLPTAVRERLERAAGSDSTAAVLTPADFPARATSAGSGGRLVWRLRADSVRDVAFAVARNVHWDARRTAVGDRDGDGTTDYTRIDALYRPAARRWREAARYGAHAITFLSDYTGLSYPWPHMSLVEGGGIIGGGMEYPMMTLIGDYAESTDADLYNVVAHELAHMWVPMQVSSDERRYSWLDEGTTTFNENQARADFFPGRQHWLGEHEQYLVIAGSGEEGEMMRRSAYHYSPEAFSIASYSKPASALIALRAVLGEEVFLRGYRGFLRDWRHRHPYPWDFFNSFAAASGQDLDWFWHAWYFTTWTLDQAIDGVSADADSTRIFVANRGRMPMPVTLRITLANGTTLSASIPVTHWLEGHQRAEVAVASPSPVVRIEIDPERSYPDVDRGNNVWVGSDER